MFLGIVVGLVTTILSIFVINKASWETLKQIKERLSNALLTKEERVEQKKFDKNVEKITLRLQKEQLAQLQERAKQIAIQEQKQNVQTQK